MEKLQVSSFEMPNIGHIYKFINTNNLLRAKKELLIYKNNILILYYKLLCIILLEMHEETQA